MPTITKAGVPQTVITTFDVTPGTCADLQELLQDAYAKVISKQHGFIGGAVHVNDAETRVCSYSQWQSREDFQAMLRIPEMRRRNREINELCKGFAPCMYDVVSTYD